jgi:hypothetical protein
MHPALWKLMRLSTKASFRRLLRGAKTVRGAIVLVLMIVGLGIYLGTMVGTAVFLGRGPETSNLAGAVAPYLPLILMGIFLQSVLRKSSGAMLLHFSPAEVDFLFAAPFRRRDLLLYKLWPNGVRIVLGALFLSMSPMAFLFRGWLSTFVGLSLSLIFVNLASLAAALLRLIVAEAAHTRARRAVLFAVATLAAAALPQTFARARVFHFVDLSASFRSTWPGQVLLAPFEVFSHAMLAERWFPDLLGWAAAATAIDVGLLLLVLKLDADYLEWSASFSQRVYEIQQRFRRSGGVMINPTQGRSRFRIPQLPWLGGAGPIGWRQLIITGRACRGAIWMALTATIGIFIWNWVASGGYSQVTITPVMVIGIIAYATFLFGTMIAASFRGDLHHIEVLKTLPVRPLALTVGELGGCVAVVSGLQTAFMAMYGITAQTGGRLLLVAAILAPPANWLLHANGSLFLLIFPVPTTPGASNDLQVAGRRILSLLLQIIVQVPLLGIPAILAAGAYYASGLSLPAMVATAFVVLVVEAVPMTMLTAWAFDRYDPATDAPVS